MVEKIVVEVEGRRLTLSNPTKVLYPEAGFTKAEVIDYYSRVAPVLLPHLAGRPVTFTRWPDGVTGHSFFEKNVPTHAPDWVRRVRLPAPGSGKDRTTIDYALVEDLPTLVWAANLAALELHVPQWRVGVDGAARGPDLLVFDLDPGPPATVLECAQVALALRELLAADGLTAYPKTSGSKGMQLYVPVAETTDDRTSGYARDLAVRLERELPGLVVSRMLRSLRPGKVLVDWSQNNAAKTTIAPYSLRARARPTVSAPVTWDEVIGANDAEDLVVTAGDLLRRVRRDGDLLAPLLDDARPALPDPPATGQPGRTR
jgi:bifunctional non-homologous end joining protein LigD